MSFPWSVNRFISTNINNSNSITGTYENVSFKVNGNAELSADATIQRLGVGKAVNSSYIMDASGNINVNGNYYQNGTIFSPTGLLTSNNIWSGTNQFNTYYPSSTLPVTTGYTDNSFLTKKVNDALYASLGTNNTFNGTQTYQGNIDMTYSSGSLIINFGLNPPYMLGTNITGIPDGALSSNVGLKNAGTSGTPQNWSGYNSYNTNLPTSSLASGTTTTATQFLTRQMNDTRYGQLTSGVTNAWSSTNNFNGVTTFLALPTSNDLVTIPGNFTIMNKQQSSGYWPDKSGGVTNNYGSINNFNNTVTFNSSLPTSSLASGTTTTATQFLTRQMNDLRYGQILTGVTNTWASDNTFNSTLPTSTITSTTGSTQILPRAINDARYALYDAVNFNISCGANALGSKTTAQYNVALGPNSMPVVNTGSYNVCVGMNTLYLATSAGQNTVIGANSGSAITTGSANCIIGVNAGNQITTGGSNFSMGSSSGPVGAGEWSVAIGTSALQNGSSYNVCLGGYTMQNNSGGQNSVCIGYFAQTTSTAGGFNTGIGAYNYQQMTTGTNNVGIGYQSGRFVTAGQRNVFLGVSTGTNASGVDATNSVCIGYGVTCTGSNQFILGASTHAVSVAGTMTLNGLSTFTAGITASATQTINFGSNAPTMSGANISSATIPDGALSSNVALLTGTQTFSGAKTFSTAPVMSGANISSATIPDGALSSNVALLTGTQTFSGAKTFSVAPVMSGANISSATIPDAALSSNVALLTGTQTFSGAKTFSVAPVMSGANISSATIPYASLASDYRIIRASGTYNFFAGVGTVGSTLTGDSNTLYGIGTGVNLTNGNGNAFFGTNAGLYCATNSSSNTAIGSGAMGGSAPNSCSYNTAVGAVGLSSITTGQNNCGLGLSVMNILTTGSGNCFIGRYGGSAIVTGNYNCGIGDQVDYSSSYDSSYCSFLGASSHITAAGLTYVTCIGANTVCGTSNTIQLGSNSETVAFSGNLLSGANTITVAQLGYLSGVSTGIVDTATSQTIGGTKTFSTAPVMSGASITSTTIPNAALQSTVTINNTASTFSALKTFTGGIDASASQTINFGTNSIAVNSVNLMKDQGTLITAAVSLTGTLYSSYSVQAGASAFNITLPTITSTNVGQRLLFRRTGGTTTTVVSFIGNGTQNVYNTALTGGTTAQALMGSGVYKVELISCLLTSSTYAWFQI
jgi:hypothetical protein